MSNGAPQVSALQAFRDNLRATPRRFVQTAFRSGRPVTDRARSSFVFGNVFLHLHSTRTHRWSLRWATTAGLGIASVAAFLITLVTGVMLMFYYKPYTDVAYDSIKDIHFVVPTGRFMRNIHRWAANIMVVTVILHMARAFYTAAYRAPREFNWLIGLALLVTTLGLSFTGYLLPWDQLAYWAVTVGTNIASSIPAIGPTLRELLIGGRTIDQPTLIRFYALHVIVLPGALGCLFAYHMWRIRKDGGLAAADSAALLGDRIETTPVNTKTYTLLGVARGTAPAVRTFTLEAPDQTVNSVPDLTRRTAILVLGTIAAVSLLSVYVRSPLEEAANALITPNPAKAPWYFLWLQEIVTDTTIRIGAFTINGAFIGGVVLPGLLVTLLIVWPWIDRSPAAAAGRWFPRTRRTQNALFLAIVALVLVFTLIGTLCRGPYWNFYWPWQAWPDMPTRL